MTKPTTATSGNHLPPEVLELFHRGHPPRGVDQEDVDWYNSRLGEVASVLSRKDAIRIARVIQKTSSTEAFTAHTDGQQYDVWSFDTRESLLRLFDRSGESNWLLSILELLDARAASLFMEHRMDISLTEGSYLLLSENPTLASRIVTLLTQTSDNVRMWVALALYRVNSWDYHVVKHGYQEHHKSELIEAVLNTFETIMKWEPKRSGTRDAVLSRVSRDPRLLERLISELALLSPAQWDAHLDELSRRLGLI